MSELSDKNDAATKHEEELREDAIAEQQRRAGLGDPERWQELSAEACVGCGESIPEKRRELLPGVQLCVDCQTDAERLQGQTLMTRYGQRGS